MTDYKNHPAYRQAAELLVSRESLREVLQPTLHKARIDRLTLTNGDGSIRAQWTLQGSIAASDAQRKLKPQAMLLVKLDKLPSKTIKPKDSA